MNTFGTADGERLVRGQRHQIVGTDGTHFTGECCGISVAKGVLFAVFEAVEGNVAVVGKRRRFYSIPLAALTTPRPLMFNEMGC